ncbi:unnamed protein product [Gadus morhua 'NCC']
MFLVKPVTRFPSHCAQRRALVFLLRSPLYACCECSSLPANPSSPPGSHGVNGDCGLNPSKPDSRQCVRKMQQEAVKHEPLLPEPCWAHQR